MTRAEFRARVGVACITPDLLPTAFETLPIGFYKDYHALGKAHRGAGWAADLGHDDLYVPVIQYRSTGDVPEHLAMLRSLWVNGQFPKPVGVELDEFLSLLKRSGLESWLVERSKDGSLPEATMFVLGNEPGYRPNNDPRTPQQIVEDARLVRDIFERNHLGHRLALGGISTPDNAFTTRAYGSTALEFFEAILEEARRCDVTFDAFVIHPYPASGISGLADLENDFESTALAQDSISQIRAFRSIMLRYGQRDKDLIVGEVGLPSPIRPLGSELVGAYADEIMTWCLTATDEELGNPRDGNRLVQRFTWFLLAVPTEPLPGFSDNPALDFDRSVLLEPDGALTPLGKRVNAVADRLAPQR